MVERHARSWLVLVDNLTLKLPTMKHREFDKMDRDKKKRKIFGSLSLSLSVELVDVFPALDRRIRASFARDLFRNNAPLPPRRSFFERRQLVVVW